MGSIFSVDKINYPSYNNNKIILCFGIRWEHWNDDHKYNIRNIFRIWIEELNAHQIHISSTWLAMLSIEKRNYKVYIKWRELLEIFKTNEYLWHSAY